MSLALFKFVVQIGDVKLVVNQVPIAVISHMIHANYTSRSRIFEGRTRNSSNSKLHGLVERHIVAIVRIEHTVGKGASRADRKKSAL